ncbi:TetR/AcrR family transcriptional regulator [Fodinibius halophilus]|uniref:TetR/AcrR family transcriptional regulator n=1 Tax=Fodinibius halophilus TaxID=1736908 RepID=A0A6M1STI6_9BACT|nr:TetR/AcrR family transcriptional regulator [Fodinibius halophilus]NGP87248.1 TetR/AcrR family transcriptional regulator [Fodinibius halophilus]
MTDKNTDKRTALLSATLDLVSNHGFHNAPMAKIAKLADVSAGTIYNYFSNKQDLVDSLYLHIKNEFTNAAFQGYDEEKPVKEGIKLIWFNMIEYKMANPKQANFLSQCEDSQIVSASVREQALEHLQPLLNLWERGQGKGVIRDVSPYLLYAYMVYPLSFFVAVKKRDEFHLTSEMQQHSFEMAWSAITIK